MTGEAALVVVLAVVLFATGVLGLVRATRRRSTGQSYTVLRFNSVFGIAVGVVLLVVFFGVHR